MTDALACPTCSIALFAAPTRPGVHGCGTCGGIWADIETTKLVAAVLDPELVDLVDKAEARRSSGGPLAPDAPGTRACPACRVALARVSIASTNLDVCGVHGTWFDRGELRRVSLKLDAGRTLQIPRTDQGPARWVSGNTQLNAGHGPSWQGDDDTRSGQDVATDIAVSVAFALVEGIVTAALRSGSSDD